MCESCQCSKVVIARGRIENFDEWSYMRTVGSAAV
jgi:hypothetical protein